MIVLFTCDCIFSFSLCMELTFCREKEDRVGRCEGCSGGIGTEYTE